MAAEKSCGRGLADWSDHEAGSIVWNASLVLLNHLRAKHASDLRGKRVLELGAGIGHLAWGKLPLMHSSPPRSSHQHPSSIGMPQRQSCSHSMYAALLILRGTSGHSSGGQSCPNASMASGFGFYALDVYAYGKM